MDEQRPRAPWRSRSPYRENWSRCPKKSSVDDNDAHQARILDDNGNCPNFCACFLLFVFVGFRPWTKRKTMPKSGDRRVPRYLVRAQREKESFFLLQGFLLYGDFWFYTPYGLCSSLHNHDSFPRRVQERIRGRGSFITIGLSRPRPRCFFVFTAP